jgi:hypothetical protein
METRVVHVDQKIKLRELELEEKKIDMEREKIQLQYVTNNTQTKMIENQNKMIEKLGTITNNTMNNSNNSNNSNNTVNNNFNLQVFLNDTCKDAMNIMDFVKSLKYTPEDLDRVGRLGYAEAISKLMIDGLQGLEVSKRPIHCTDVKREKMYIRHDNEWKKDMESTGKLKTAIKVVGHDNMCALEKWKEKHPLYNQFTSKHHSKYMEICNKVMAGMLDEDSKEYRKIMKRLIPETTIVKEVKEGSGSFTSTLTLESHESPESVELVKTSESVESVS